MSYDRLSPVALASGNRIWVLVDLYFGGDPLRLAGTELDVSDSASGDDYHYVAAFDDVDISEAVDLLSDSSGQGAIPIDVVLPVDAALLIARGIELSGARVVVSQWVEGTDYSLRRVVLEGVVSSPQVGEEGEPVSFSAEEIARTATGMYPSPEAMVSSSTWAHISSLHDEHLNIAYPTIIGKPGIVSTDVQSGGRITASKAAWADYRNSLDGGIVYGLIAVIAGHHVSAERVIVANDGLTDGIRMIVVDDYDTAGNPVAALLWYTSYTGGAYPTTNGLFEYDATTTFDGRELDTDGVTVYGLGDPPLSGVLVADYSLASDEQVQADIHISWLDEIGEGGGLQWRGRLLRDASDVIEWALTMSGLPIDHGRCAAQARGLAGYHIDAVIEARVNLWDWLRDAIVPLLPISIVSGPDGYYYIVWRYDATASDSVLHLDADEDPDVEIVSRIETDSSKVANDFSLNYAYCSRTGNQVATARLANVTYIDSAPRTLPSELCKASQDRRKRAKVTPVVEDALDTDCVYEDSTAHLINRWRVAAQALPQERLRVRATAGKVSRIERGSIVTVTRAGLGLAECVALVLDVNHTDGDLVELGILLRRWPSHDLRAS